jgi:hypothetical protein
VVENSVMLQPAVFPRVKYKKFGGFDLIRFILSYE